MDETLALIHQHANERHELYKLAGHQRLTTEQVNRIQYLTDHLAVLWDQHRREVAAQRYGQPEVLSFPSSAHDHQRRIA